MHIYIHICVYVRVRCSDVAGSKARKQETREARSFRFVSRLAIERAMREIREKDRKSRSNAFSLSFSLSLFGSFFLFFFFLQCSQSTIFQFFRRCPLPWHRRLLSPPLCLLLRFRISVLAFGYLKKIQRKNIKRNSSQSRRCQISYHFVFFFFLSLFSFYNI